MDKLEPPLAPEANASQSKPYRVSDETKAKMEAVTRRTRQFYATAHLYWFD